MAKSQSARASSLECPPARGLKRMGVFRVAQRGRRGEDVDQQLEAGVAESAHRPEKRGAPDHEKAGQWIAHVAAQRHAHERVAEFRQRGAPASQHRAIPVGAEVARPADEVDALALESVQHRRNARGVVLPVAIHDAEKVSAAAEHALDAGLREPRIGDPQDQPDARVLARELLDGLRGGVGRVVVDELHLPVDSGERKFEFAHDAAHVVGLIEDRNYDRQSRRGGHGGGQRAAILGRVDPARCVETAVNFLPR
jgi:hypothetical protein